MLKWILAIFVALSALFITGCQKPLFSGQANMTPYQRYQQLHNEQPITRGGNWGISADELRARLEPLDN